MLKLLTRHRWWISSHRCLRKYVSISSQISMLNHLRLLTLRWCYYVVSLSIVNHKRSEVTSIPIGTAISVWVVHWLFNIYQVTFPVCNFVTNKDISFKSKQSIYSSDQKDQHNSSNERKSSITSFMEPIKPQNWKNFFLTQWVMKWEKYFLIVPVIKICRHN